jgi:UDP-glucose 4-epimerase
VTALRIVIVGATGNVGTSLVEVLADDPAGHELIGVARRKPAKGTFPEATWLNADIRHGPLADIFRGADAVVHLAWAIQPSHDGTELRSTNVDGSRRVFQAVAEAGVPALVYASSVGTYGPGPGRRRVAEDWPPTGIPSSFYSRHKAEVEALLNAFEREHPQVRVVRMRPSLIFKRAAGLEVAGLFLGPLIPRLIASSHAIPFVPAHPRLRFQTVHTGDVAQAYRLALLSDVRGAFNIAAEPVLDGPGLARLLDARAVPVPAALMRGLAWATWKLRLQPTPPGWVDMGLSVPLMDCSRARNQLGWEPSRTSAEALLELLAGIRDGETAGTPATAGHGAARI